MNIGNLHSAYCKATGFDLPLRFDRQRAWFDFEKAGFTADDIALVVRWIRRQIANRVAGYASTSLRFSTLIVQLDEFEEKLMLARAELKRRPDRPRLETVEQQVGDVRRLVEVPASDQTVTGDVASAEFLAELEERRRRRQETARKNSAQPSDNRPAR